MIKQIFDFCILSFLIACSASLKLGSSSSIKSPTTDNLIQNGDFEQPAFSAGNSWQIFGSTQNTGWTLRENEIEIGIGTIYNQSWSTGRVCELDARKNNRISQTLTLDALDYFLEFDVARRVGSSTPTTLMNVFFNDSIIYAFTPENDHIVHQKIKVKAIKGSNTIAFEGAGISDSYGATIDNVLFYKKNECDD